MVVRKDGRGADEYAIGQGGRLVNEGVVLDLAAIPDAYTFANVGTPPDNRVIPDTCVFAYLSKVPDARARSDERTGGDVGTGLDHDASLSLSPRARVRSQIPTL